MKTTRYLASDPGSADTPEDYGDQDWVEHDSDDWSPLANQWCELHQRPHREGGLTCEVVSDEAYYA